MITFGIAAAWIAISIAGAKGLVLFARAAASNQFDADPNPVAAQNGLGREDARWNQASVRTPGARR
jgi:hypothetical protein